MVEVVGTAEFEAWYLALDDADGTAVNRAVGKLEQAGVTLGFPQSSGIKTSSIAMRELRAGSKGGAIRIFYIFDAARQAVLLIGGDKTGDKRFYERMVPLAEKIWRQYCKETGQ